MKTTNPVTTIGLDLGDKRHAICVLNRDGEIIDERSITNHRESLRRLAVVGSPEHGAEGGEQRAEETHDAAQASLEAVRDH